MGSDRRVETETSRRFLIDSQPWPIEYDVIRRIVDMNDVFMRALRMKLRNTGIMASSCATRAGRTSIWLPDYPTRHPLRSLMRIKTPGVESAFSLG